MLVRALDLQAEGRLELAEQDDAAATYAEKIEAAERRLDPARPAAELARVVRALTPHVGAYLEMRRGRAAGRAPGARRSRPGAAAGRAARRGRRPAARLRRGRAAARGRAAGRGQADGGRRLPARPPADRRHERGASGGIAPARLLAYEVIRATFEEDAFTERAFREAAGGAAGRRPRARPGAADRLRRGPAPRNQPTRRSNELADRSPRMLDPPVIAALRLGLYELLFADGTPDHAAVDQSVELVKKAGAAHASGLVNAVLRRAAREREAADRVAARRRLDPGARRGRPLGAALAGADVVGGARRRRRPLAARRLQPPGRGRLPDRRLAATARR